MAGRTHGQKERAVTEVIGLAEAVDRVNEACF